MLVRVARRFERALWIGALGTAVVAGVMILPQNLRAQDTAAAPKSHTVKRGDTLWELARSYFGDSYLWPEIYRLNVDVIEDPHWIYPGEVLKLPTEGPAKVIAVAPPAPAPTQAAQPPQPVAPPAPDTTRPVVVDTAPPAALAPVEPQAPPPAMMQAPTSVVRVGEYAAAPWVDATGGPRNSGYIIQNGEVSAIASVDHSRINVYDPTMIAPPPGMTAEPRQLFLVYRLGPLIENFGQIVIPTGVMEVTRSNRPGEAAVARLVHQFTEVLQGQQLIPYDSVPALVEGHPSVIENGRSGFVRWTYHEPVLASIQSYLVVDITGADGVKTGDQIELYQPRQGPVDGRPLALPEIYIGRAQVLRVTPFGASAIITGQAQTRIEEGTAARIAAKMP